MYLLHIQILQINAQSHYLFILQSCQVSKTDCIFIYNCYQYGIKIYIGYLYSIYTYVAYTY